MSHRVISIMLCAVSLAAIPLGYFLLHPDLIGLCPKNLNANCLSESIDFGIGKPLYWSIRWLPLLFFVLIFVRKEVFATWWKVTGLVAVVALLLIVTSPVMPAFLTPDRTEMTDLMQKVFVIISVIVIAWKYWWLSRNAKTKPTRVG